MLAICKLAPVWKESLVSLLHHVQMCTNVLEVQVCTKCIHHVYKCKERYHPHRSHPTPLIYAPWPCFPVKFTGIATKQNAYCERFTICNISDDTVQQKNNQNIPIFQSSKCSKSPNIPIFQVSEGFPKILWELLISSKPQLLRKNCPNIHRVKCIRMPWGRRLCHQSILVSAPDKKSPIKVEVCFFSHRPHVCHGQKSLYWGWSSHLS